MLRSSTPLMMVTLGETLTQRVGIVNLGSRGSDAGRRLCRVRRRRGHRRSAGRLRGRCCCRRCCRPCTRCCASAAAPTRSAAALRCGRWAWAYIVLRPRLHRRQGNGSCRDRRTRRRRPSVSGPILRNSRRWRPWRSLLVVVAGLWLYRTRTGLNWRIVGKSFADRAGDRLRRCWCSYRAFSSAAFCPAFAGAILSVDYTQTWANDMTKGRGFVAVGLVIVARWNPFLVFPVVLMFGLSEAATLRLQAAGLTLSPYLIACLPYLVCLLCVIVASMREGRIGGMPAELASVFGRRR